MHAAVARSLRTSYTAPMRHKGKHMRKVLVFCGSILGMVLCIAALSALSYDASLRMRGERPLGGLNHYWQPTSFAGEITAAIALGAVSLVCLISLVRSMIVNRRRH